MVDVPGAKFAEELLGSERLEVVDEELPELEDVVAGEVVPPLDDDDLGTEQLGLNGCPEAAGSSPGHQDTHLFGQVALVGLLAGLLVQDLEDLPVLERDLVEYEPAKLWCPRLILLIYYHKICHRGILSLC